MTSFMLVADIRELAPRAGELERRLPAERRRVMRGYRLPDDRLRSLAAGLLMGEVAAGQPIMRGEFGKPYVDGGPHFNVSHSGEYVVMAVAEVPVGVDVEMRRDDDYARLAEVSFHPEERRLLAEKYCREFFYDIWALKESYMKMTGRGFSLEPTSFCLKHFKKCREILHLSGGGSAVSVRPAVWAKRHVSDRSQSSVRFHGVSENAIEARSVPVRLAIPEDAAVAFGLYGDLPGYSLAACVRSGPVPEVVSRFHP